MRVFDDSDQSLLNHFGGDLAEFRSQGPPLAFNGMAADTAGILEYVFAFFAGFTYFGLQRVRRPEIEKRPRPPFAGGKTGDWASWSGEDNF